MVKNQEYYESLDKNSDEYRAYAKFNRISNEAKPMSKKDCLKVGKLSFVAIIYVIHYLYVLSIIALILTIIFL
tara:strand:- start:7 stop:225 length:219 start_codon:yes stop_codon:yes gene_type:complete